MKTLSLFVVVVVVVALKWTAGYVTNDDDDDVWQAPSYLGQVDTQFCFPFSPNLTLLLYCPASHMVCSWRQPQARVLHNGQRLMPSLDGERTTMCAGNVAMLQLMSASATESRSVSL